MKGCVKATAQRQNIGYAPIYSRRQYVVSNIKTIRAQINHLRLKPTLNVHDYSLMEELMAELNDQKNKLAAMDPLEDYCETHPDEDECRVYEQ